MGRVIDTNLKSVFRLCKAVVRGMVKARAGRIINIPPWWDRAASRAVSTMPRQGRHRRMTRSLSREIAARGSRSIASRRDSSTPT